MSSAAEERLRIKAEAALRATWSGARIVHELMLRQGGCRIDLAAITADRLIVVEVKSERDVLTRLKRQAEQARVVADGFSVILPEKHWRKAWEENHVSILEAGEEDEFRLHLQRDQRRAYEATCNAPARLDMLWAEELRIVAGSGAKATRDYSIRCASDSLTGAEVRRRVCAALRAREFPRADPPILSELFTRSTMGVL
jgi:hypothetical protein